MTNTKRKMSRIIEDECSCSEFKYTPDKDLKIHQENAIRHICSGIHAHEHGLPEWLKNSADAYARINAPKSKRVIILIFDYGRKNISSSISCLDFVGMTSDDIEKYFRHWADPEAADRGKKGESIQGGHGNGGKCYMVQMFDEYACVHTVKKGRGNLYGVPAGSIQFGYIPDKEKGRDFTVNSLKEELNKTLSRFRCSIDILPKAAIDAINSADGFSVFTGYRPKTYDNKIPTDRLIKSLRDHPQMLRTLQTCKVYIIVNGKLENARRPLTLPEVKPMKGAEKVREIEIPSRLTDPATSESVSTTNNGKFHRGKLKLYTSAKSMRYGLKARHTIRYISKKLGDFGYVPVTDLDIQSPFRDRIYGICHLEALEQYKQNIRAQLADSPLTRAVQDFIAKQIQDYAKEFEQRERKKYDQQERHEISKMNEALDRWKNRFLREMMQGLWGPGEEGSRKRRINLPVGKVAKMQLYLTHKKAGRGVCLRPMLHFYDKDNNQIRSVAHRWISEDNNIAMVDEDLNLIETFSYGETKIYAETLDGNIRSNSVPLEVVNIKKIRIFPEVVELQEGGRQRLIAICQLDDGSETKEVYLSWDEDDSSIAKVSTAGLVFGFRKGETKVVAWDENCMPSNPALIRVTAGAGKDAGNKRGSGYPKILISGPFDPDPDTGLPVNLSSDDPPVYQRPQDVDRNIWWINSAAPLASLFLDKEEGYGYESNGWRIYHLERYIDIIVQIVLSTSKEEKEALNVKGWIDEWMIHVSEIQERAFLELHDFITKGELPLTNQ